MGSNRGLLHSVFGMRRDGHTIAVVPPTQPCLDSGVEKHKNRGGTKHDKTRKTTARSPAASPTYGH